MKRPLAYDLDYLTAQIEIGHSVKVNGRIYRDVKALPTQDILDQLLAKRQKTTPPATKAAQRSGKSAA